MDLAKLKVADLKAELAARNLDTKGVKAVLLERLKEAIERESNATVTAAVGLSSPQQFQAQQHFLLQQQHQQQQQQQHQQQQLFLQQQQLQEQQLLLQHQQLLQQQQQQQTFNEVSSEVLHQHEPQEQAIEDLSMPNKRAETPVRRSRRRSMTRSPSPTNSLGEHTPAASLLGSARKRGRSRSMTKSPSPQRLVEAASCLEAVQEEPEPPVTAAADERLDAQMELTDTVWPEVKGEDSGQSFDAFVAADHTQLLSEKSEDTLGSSVPDVEPVFAMDTEAPEVKPPSSLLDEDDVRRDENQEHTSEDPLAADESSNVATEDEVSPLPPAESELAKVEVKAEVEGNEEQTVEKQEADEKVLKTEPEPAASGGEEKGKESSDAGNKKQTQHTNTIEFLSEEIEPQLADEASKAQLSWYDSDINLMINPKDCLSAKPLSDGIFGLVWGGARANRGFTGGRVFYEVSVGDELQPATRSPFVPEGEECTPEIRIGWSTLVDGKRNLGETACSFGYASSGQKVSSGTFEDYGATFGKHDVVGAYLDLESQPCSIQFTLNRVRQGEAFVFEKDSLDSAALFPHIYTKNLSFKINFGTVQEGFPLKVAEKVTAAKEESDKATDDKVDADSSKDESQKSAEPEADLAEEESKADDTQEKVAAADTSDTAATSDEDPVAVSTESVPFDPEFHFCDRFIEENPDLIVEGLKGPPTRDCCELIMMIGLPGSGKTHWVQNYLLENTEASFTVLSVNSLLENMKILAQPREPSNTPQWQKVIEQLTRNIGRLIEIACKRRRHVLVDQTNVFSSEQKRRLRGFGGFKLRRAVAVIPSVEEYKRRYEEKVAKYGKEVPDTNLNTMKANIFVPSAELKLYTEIMFPELPETEAREMIKKLNEEGRKLIPPRRQRGNQSNRNHHNQKNSGSSNSSNSYTSRWNHNRSQGQYANKTNRYGSGSGGGGSGGGGYNRYGNKSNDSSQYHHQHHRAGGDYRSGGGNGYGRRDDHQRGGAGYGGGSGGGNRYDSWSRNSGGYYNDRGYTNRGYQQQQQDHSNNRYDARRRDRRGYNSSGWNAHGGQQQQQQWNNYGGNSGTSDTWYSWWQSNLKNLLHQGGGQNGGSGDQSGSSSGAYWNQQYSHQNASSSYGNYHSKGGSGGSSNIGSN